MPHNLIEMTNWPSMPAPWSSVDPGEAWVWGDYVALFQSKPISVAEMTAKMTGQKGIGASPMQYPFAMTVFYRKDRNPHGPSSRPVLVATLERMNYAAAAKMFGAQGIDFSSMPSSDNAPVFQGLFTAETRSNLGYFHGELTRDSARSHFLNLIRQHLSPTGEPVRIGAMSNVHGHPNTGWPAQKEKKSSGCLSVIVAFSAIITPIAIWTLISYK